jgi:colanic acid/amylovoran biosynthesis glycosyltransferase
MTSPRRDDLRISNASAFYDGWTGSFLADYVYGNPRAEAAIRHILAHIPRCATRIVDVGCGIGWSTWEIQRSFPHAFVLGIDLSEKAIEIATRLFGDSKAVFRAGDVCQLAQITDGAFDAIVLGDVYEHIPKNRRAQFQATLRASLADGGCVILTFPSVVHQDFLRRNGGHGLQPVDEDVTFEDVRELSDGLGGRIVTYGNVSIWRTHDYVHAAIALPRSEEQESVTPSTSFRREARRIRLARVSSRLDVRVTRDGMLLPNRGSPVVCVISPNAQAYSETFIRAHIERLPAIVRVLHGGWFPTYTENGSPLLSDHTGARIARACVRRLLRLPPEYFPTRALVRFLEANGVEVVLAEYGPTGVAVLDACARAEIPLVVHFHGFDAYHRPTLQAYDQAYVRLFGTAAAVVVVSRDMERALLSLGARRETLFYNPYGVDTTLFAGGDPAAARPLFVAVGRFVEKKAPHLVVLAFAEVRKACPDARMIMVGDGPLLGSTQHLARALGIGDAIEFLGPRPHSEVATIVRQARAFVQHSVVATDGDAEGTPVAVLEAGAAGVPVVATRHGGIPDAVVSGETGFLVDEGDVRGMAAHMIRLAKDPLLADRLGRAASERICAEFSSDKALSALLRILEDARRTRKM